MTALILHKTAISFSSAQESNEDSDADDCTDRDWTLKNVLGGLLVKSGILDEGELKLHTMNNDTYLQFDFLGEVQLKGWKIRGRDGGMLGPLRKRRGLVVSYVVTGIEDDGEVFPITDRDTDEEEFVSDSNLAHPEEVTAEDLKRDVSVNSVRFTPVVWSGVPFLSVTILFCATDAIIIPPDQPQSTDDTDSIDSLKEQVKSSRTASTLDRMLEATKMAVGGRKQTLSPVDTPISPHVPSPNCLRPSSWRYAAKPIPVDQFTARGNPEQAWRAILGLRYIPYLFPDRTKAGFGDQGDSRHQLLQIVFRSRSRVEGIKVAGLGEVGGKTGAWGVVSKFSLLYKTPDHHWAYYSDSNQTPRVFKIGERNYSTAQKEGVFHLPNPIYTEALGIFPHDYSNRPYMAVDIMACYTKPFGRERTRNTTRPAIELWRKRVGVSTERDEGREDDETESEADEKDYEEKTSPLVTHRDSKQDRSLLDETEIIDEEKLIAEEMGEAKRRQAAIGKEVSRKVKAVVGSTKLRPKMLKLRSKAKQRKDRKRPPVRDVDESAESIKDTAGEVSDRELSSAKKKGAGTVEHGGNAVEVNGELSKLIDISKAKKLPLIGKYHKDPKLHPGRRTKSGHDRQDGGNNVAGSASGEEEDEKGEQESITDENDAFLKMAAEMEKAESKIAPSNRHVTSTSRKKPRRIKMKRKRQKHRKSSKTVKHRENVKAISASQRDSDDDTGPPEILHLVERSKKKNRKDEGKKHRKFESMRQKKGKNRAGRKRHKSTKGKRSVSGVHRGLTER